MEVRAAKRTVFMQAESFRRLTLKGGALLEVKQGNSRKSKDLLGIEQQCVLSGRDAGVQGTMHRHAEG